MLVISVRKSTNEHLCELCTNLLSNTFGGLLSHLHAHTNESTQRRVLLELLVHAIAVFHSGSRLLYPLHLVATRPQTIRVSTINQSMWSTNKGLCYGYRMYLSPF